MSEGLVWSRPDNDTLGKLLYLLEIALSNKPKTNLEYLEEFTPELEGFLGKLLVYDVGGFLEEGEKHIGWDFKLGEEPIGGFEVTQSSWVKPLEEVFIMLKISRDGCFISPRQALAVLTALEEFP